VTVTLEINQNSQVPSLKVLLEEQPVDPDAQPLWEEIVQEFRSLSPEELARLSKDGAEHHDHYIYGNLKR